MEGELLSNSPKKAPFAHVRVKHGYTTVFVEVVLDEDGATLRHSAALLLDVESDKLRLLRQDGDGFVLLQDKDSISKQGISCDSVLVGVVKSNIDGKWEQPDMQVLRL